jgi:3-phytase
MKIFYFNINSILTFGIQLILLASLVISCSHGSGNEGVHTGDTRLQMALLTMDSAQDSADFINSLHAQSLMEHSIPVDAETQPVESEFGEDAADDPAIWVNHKDPAKSLILGTNKRAGLYAYDLGGQILQYRKVGRLNNVDLRQGFPYQSRELALVAGSNRENNSITLFFIDPENAHLSDSVMNIPSGVDEVYGVCMYHRMEDNSFFVFVNGKGGQIEQWEVTGGNAIEAQLVARFSFPSQPEGMVVDDERGILYIGVEDVGIYQVAIDEIDRTMPMLLPGSDSTNSKIAYDIEGLALFSHEGRDFLLASIQGNFSYAIFQLGENEGYHSSFILSSGGQVDGAEETDGLEISQSQLGAAYPEGMLVVQDGFNFEGDSLVNQNFKIVSFASVLQILK